MRQSFWLNIALLLGVAVIGAVVYFQEPDAPADHALSALTPAGVVSVRIERRGADAVVLERKKDAWFLVQPFAARADEFMIQRMLAILRARTRHRYPASDLARFDLDQPRVRLTIDGQRFEFGLVNELSQEQYVLTGDAVFAIPARYGLALPARPEALADRRFFAPGESPVRIAPPGFTVTRTEGRWEVNPALHGVSEDEAASWVDQWRLASALRIGPYQEGETKESVEIELSNGATLAVGILSRKPELILLRPDQRLQYYFAQEFGARLLSPPGTASKQRPDKN